MRHVRMARFLGVRNAHRAIGATNFMPYRKLSPTAGEKQGPAGAGDRKAASSQGFAGAGSRLVGLCGA